MVFWVYLLVNNVINQVSGVKSLQQSDMHQDLEIVSVMPVNHWTIFLEIPSGQSVRVDMNPLGYGNKFLRGQILVSSKTCRYTQKTMRTLPFPTWWKI
ncbi:hypothetical protein E4U46_008274 [Claviceps purpurea]|nr:hypothetical protein E4U46_008274 [Claviceps purpurea]